MREFPPLEIPDRFETRESNDQTRTMVENDSIPKDRNDTDSPRTESPVNGDIAETKSVDDHPDADSDSSSDLDTDFTATLSADFDDSVESTEATSSQGLFDNLLSGDPFLRTKTFSDPPTLPTNFLTEINR